MFLMFFAAAPPDVREVFNLPEWIPPIFFGAMPPPREIWGIAPKGLSGFSEGKATSANRAA